MKTRNLPPEPTNLEWLDDIASDFGDHKLERYVVRDAAREIRHLRAKLQRLQPELEQYRAGQIVLFPEQRSA